MWQGTEPLSEVNWQRPIEMVKVKRWNGRIAVDACCAPLVQFIDSLPQTETCWCCCMHGTAPDGGVEFRSSLPEAQLRFLLGPLERCIWHDKGDMVGRQAFVVCSCPPDVREAALRHFGPSGVTEPCRADPVLRMT